MHKNRHVVPGFLTIKLISNEERGLKLVAFITPLSHEPGTFMALTSEESSIILGVSR